MMTDKQKDAFKNLKEGRLNAKQKADFYYRMSKILKEELDNLTDIVKISNELPDSYLEKIDLRRAAISAMDLTEKLVERIGPSPIAAKDENSKYHIYRHFRVDLSGKLPGLTQSTIGIDVSYEPTEEEVQFFGQLMHHITKLEEIYQSNERPNEIFTPEELDKKVAYIAKGRPYAAKVVSLVGTPIEEVGKNIIEGKTMATTGLPSTGDVKLKDIGLESQDKRDESQP